MAATTTTNLAALIPDELISGILIQSMGDKANLKNLAAVRSGFVSYSFAELTGLTAAAVVEGAAVVPAAVAPVGTLITATPQEVPPIQLTKMALRNQQVDWVNLSGALGKALNNRMNAQLCETFDDTFNANRNSAASTTGGGAAAALDLATLELAIEIAEGNNSKAQPFGGSMGLAAVLAPSQISAIRSAIRGAGNFVQREDVLAINPALPADGLVFGYYNVAIYASTGVGSGAFVGAAGAGVALQTGAAGAGAGFKRGALFSVGEALGFVEESAPSIRSEETVLIGSGGVNLVAGYVGAAGRISEQLTLIESL